MNYQVLNVPQGTQYLSKRSALLNLLPQTGKYILNKVNTGCGGTTLFLESTEPCILVSPRSNVLYSKSEQFPNAHLFRTRTDKDTSVPVLKNRLSDYIYNCGSFINTPWNSQRKVPKILVTIDSYTYVAEQLSYMGILDKFIVLVDEFQCILGDSKFKGRTELEFLHNLRGVKSVCYMSATPIDESYIEYIPEFNDVSTYYRLKWDPSVMKQQNLDMRPYKPHQSSKGICKEIIDEYRKNGFFARKIINGQEVQSHEVVIFLNDVRTILQIIIENRLPPNDVNVLCSSGNKYVKDLKTLKVHVGELVTDPNNPVNCTFTFVTRASFEGVDFYSRSAFTYIFSDAILSWNRYDLIVDVPQILGRQRLDQPFKNDAVLYYRPESKTAKALNDMAKRIIEKSHKTERWIAKYNSCGDVVIREMLKDGIDKRSDQTRYEDDYVEFVDDIHGGYVVKQNYLVQCTEIRDWQLASQVYGSSTNIIKTLVNGTSISVTNACGCNQSSGSSVLDKFKDDFFKATTFPDKMRIYSDMRSQHPKHDVDLYQNPFIDFCYHEAYDVLGAKRIKTLRYREKDIRQATASHHLVSCVVNECKSVFLPGQCYRLPEVKNILQAIYNKVGFSANAKADDITKFIPSAQRRQHKNRATGKRELHYKF